MFDVRVSLFILFMVAFASQAVLIYAYWVEGMRPNPQLSWAALSLTWVCVTIMAALAIATQNPGTRWLSAGLIGGVALAFSALTIISIGFLIAPCALALIVVSCVMLILNRRARDGQEQ